MEPEEGKVLFRGSFPQISLKIRGEGKPGAVNHKLEELAQRVRGKISQFIYAEGDTSMEETVGRLFIERKLTMAVAESCTGGLIGHRITNVPGCSQYFKSDLVTSTYHVKGGVPGLSAGT